MAPGYLLFICFVIVFVQHDLKGVLKFMGRNMDPSPPPLHRP